ncbi:MULTISPECIES: RidA family protein [unclassified Mesorhizobium]|uniref:RidA family protein n=1 Tax=unclassified Mesorhizobium TaxID=325217 RepID=UPI0024154654|nr:MULTISPECIES: RidA family protein [unclassified Mesorhizobium]MDG4889942.1 RidA family protein [Mesorhizobium sp. WSM4887]MDG4904085.1 RidA family protein [Mesorhizobium sp. WSM4962]MDG4909112.1 RidA family protein [Mesorhizobium sp. WSM4898]MDG4921736.1 RidA family protein [Mesorhizobium sp. WSM4989]
MTQTIDERLKDLGLEVPEVTAPTANYVPTRQMASTLYVSGQIPKLDGQAQYVGKVGDTISLEDAKDAARLCALNMVAQLKAALGGDLDRVAGCLRVRGFVNAVPDFKAHAAVMNGASDLLVEIFGDKGRHTRTAIGVGSLPQGVAVEVDADFAILD